MSLDYQFLRLMTHTVVVQQMDPGSTDGYGVRTATSASTMKARIEQKVQIIKDVAMRDSWSTTTLYVPPTDVTGIPVEIDMSSQITLPPGYGPAGQPAPPIINVERHNDETGRMYTKVYL